MSVVVSSGASASVSSTLNTRAAVVRATSGPTTYETSVRINSMSNGGTISGSAWTDSSGTFHIQEYYYRLGSVTLSGATAVGYGALMVDGTGVGQNLSATASGALIGIGGTLNNAVVKAPDAAIFALKGAVVNGYQVDSGGRVYAGNVSGTEAGNILTAKGLTDLGGPGALSGGTVLTGGTSYILPGGTDTKSIIQGEQYVSSGGKTVNNTVNSGGAQNVYWSGTSVSTFVASSGTIVASSGATVTVPTISGGQVFLNQGAIQLGGVVLAHGTLTVSSGAIVSGASVGAGGTELVMSGGINSGGSVLTGGTEIVYSGGSADSLSVGSGGSLILQAGSILTGTNITSGAVIDVDWMQYVSGGTVHLNGNTLTVTQGGNTWTTTFNGTFKDSDYFILSEDSDGSTILTFICYLAGTMIRTAAGEKAVEDFEIGDEVVTYEDGREVIKTVTWVGEKTAQIRRDLPLDRAGYPVCIMANAIAPGVPSQDLFVTPEHCMYFEGGFVPARMLVNGRTIYYDTSASTYKYYHIETSSHSVLWANGALSESYLNTGNRREFTQNGNIVRFAGDTASSWADDAAAPLLTSRHEVESLFEQLLERAVSMNVTPREAQSNLTQDMDLHLVTPAGQRIDFTRSTEGGRFVFVIPGGVDEVRLVSRFARPSDVHGSFVDDRRVLGVLIANIELWTHGGRADLDHLMTHEGLPGWNNVEDGNARWTTGDALLKLPDLGSTEQSVLSFEVRAGGPYTLHDSEPRLLSAK